VSGALLLSDDEALRVEVARLAGPVDARSPGPAARAAWQAALVVVVGLDALVALAAAGLPRREAVVLAARRELVADEWSTAVALGVAAVVVLPGQERVLLDHLGAGSIRPAGSGRVLAVVGGSGGAGASTTAAALALVAGRAGAALLIDADPHGGGLDVLLGIEDRPGARWRELAGMARSPDPAALLRSLPGAEGVAVLSGGFGELYRPPAAAAAAVRDAARRMFAVVVVDLPRVFDPAAEVWLAAADLVVIVVVGTVRAVAAAATVTRSVADRGRRTALVVRDVGGSALSGDDVAAGLGLPVVGTIRGESAVLAAAEHGRPPVSAARSRRRRPGSLERLCEDLLSPASPSVAA
jgi:secretion/DNA translocation related CpaE-like protein